jgi:hypothetical protein
MGGKVHPVLLIFKWLRSKMIARAPYSKHSPNRNFVTLFLLSSKRYHHLALLSPSSNRSNKRDEEPTFVTSSIVLLLDTCYVQTFSSALRFHALPIYVLATDTERKRMKEIPTLTVT